MITPEKIVYERMLKEDAFSQWLGIRVEEVSLGYAKLSMTIRPEMLNGFKIAHGGISFSFADSAFAFASNSRGQLSYSIETGINHLEKLMEGDTIFAEAKEEYFNEKLGKYRVEVTKGNGDLVALFHGMVYRTKKEWK